MIIKMRNQIGFCVGFLLRSFQIKNVLDFSLDFSFMSRVKPIEEKASVKPLIWISYIHISVKLTAQTKTEFNIGFVDDNLRGKSDAAQCRHVFVYFHVELLGIYQAALLSRTDSCGTKFVVVE